MKSLVQPEIVRRMKALFLSFTLIGACQPAVHGAAGTVFLWSWSAETVTNVPAGLTNVVYVAAGLAHAMALRDDGTVVAWGIDSGYGETQVPAGLTNVVSISAGWNFSMALRRDGSVVTWGDTYFIKPPPDLTNVLAIAAGGHAFCVALRADKTVVAWGWNGSGQTNVPSGLTNVVAVAAGLDHSVALRSDGTVTVWGSDVFDETNMPGGLSNVVAISAGWSQTLALRADGTVVGWGFDALVPAGLSNAVAVACGWDAGQEILLNDGTLDYGYGASDLGHMVSVAREHFFSIAITVPGDPASAVAVPLAGPRWSAGQFSASTQTSCGRVYALEYKNTLTATNWLALPLVAGNGEVQIIRDGGAVAPQRFYRLLKW